MSNDNKLEVSRDLLAVIETFISSQADSFPKINVPRGLRSEGLDHISKELRAILAAPQSEHKPFGWWRVPKDFPLQGAFFSYVEGESERDVQNAINHEFGFNVKWLYDEPVAQHPQPAERLTIAETRNAELVKLLREHANHVATLADALFRSGACMAAREFSDKAYAALEHQQIVNAFLKSTESGANNE